MFISRVAILAHHWGVRNRRLTTHIPMHVFSEVSVLVQERVRSIMHSKRSQKAAANVLVAKGLRKICKEGVAGGGNATKG